MPSVGCESTKAGNVPARKTPHSAKMKMSAAQLMLDLPSGLRRFCAASVKKGSRTFAAPRRLQDVMRVESLFPEARLGCALDYFFWKLSFYKLISAKKWKHGLTFSG